MTNEEIKELPISSNATHTLGRTTIYNLKPSSDDISCQESKCVLEQNFQFNGDGQSCNASFICDDLQGYSCGDYGLSISLPTTGFEPTEVCLEGQSVQGVLEQGQSVKISLWHTHDSEPDFNCYFWCRSNKRTNDDCDCGDICEGAAEHSQFPWHVQILKYSQASGFELHCSGALIDNTYILSAAHCFGTCPEKAAEAELTAYKIVLGKTSLKDPEDNVLISNIAELSIHPNFNFSGSHPQYDLALVQLQTGLEEISDNARPICLPLDFGEDYR